MGRVYRKTEYTAEERAEIQRIRQLPKAELLKTTGEKITSANYNALMKIMGDLRARREELGLGQAEVAERMGIAVSALSRLEKFKIINPKSWTLLRWAEALDCSIDLTLQARKLETARSTS